MGFRRHVVNVAVGVRVEEREMGLLRAHCLYNKRAEVSSMDGGGKMSEVDDIGTLMRLENDIAGGGDVGLRCDRVYMD